YSLVADFEKRNELFTNNSYTGELSGQQIEDYHDAVFQTKSLPLEAWTPYLGKQYYGTSFRDDALFNDSAWIQTINLLTEHTLFPVTNPVQSIDPEYTPILDTSRLLKLCMGK